MTHSTPPTRYGFGAMLAGPLDEAVERTKEALKGEGFGVLTTIDVRDTMKQKLGVEIEPYVILGAATRTWPIAACKPNRSSASSCRATSRSVSVRKVWRSWPSTRLMLGVVGANPELAAVAAEAAARLRRVIAALGGQTS